jgi:hypothetical protein
VCCEVKAITKASTPQKGLFFADQVHANVMENMGHARKSLDATAPKLGCATMFVCVSSCFDQAIYLSEQVSRDGMAVIWLVRKWSKNMQFENQLGNCTIEYAASWSDQSLPCGKRAVARCADCGSSICSDCSLECCGRSFCGQCYDYHMKHVCLRKPVQSDQGTQDRTEVG